MSTPKHPQARQEYYRAWASFDALANSDDFSVKLLMRPGRETSPAPSVGGSIATIFHGPIFLIYGCMCTYRVRERERERERETERCSIIIYTYIPLVYYIYFKMV